MNDCSNPQIPRSNANPIGESVPIDTGWKVYVAIPFLGAIAFLALHIF
jgi:hypothetical protein